MKKQVSTGLYGIAKVSSFYLVKNYETLKFKPNRYSFYESQKDDQFVLKFQNL